MSYITKNKEFVNVYPFLAPKDPFSGEIDSMYDYSYTLYDNIPIGWKNTFGKMMLDEIRDELIRTNQLLSYQVYDIKEKYGELRWYASVEANGSVLSEIIDKYMVISGHVCIKCGKPDVPMVRNGWISPICEDCWSGTKEDYKRYTNKSDEKIPETYTVRCFDTKQAKDITYDISDTVRKIRYQYQKKKESENGKNK